jgi:folate-binding protein YgfZ
VTAGEHVTELVLLRGPDALSYSDSQSTQDLSGLQVGASAATFVLDPKGEIVAAALLRRVEAEAVSFEVPVGVGEPLRARLERFAIRSKVDIDGPVPLGASDVAALDSELSRIKAGLPGPAELARGLVVHGVAGQLRERCVSFTKGCYPGQELVARMQARGATPPWVLCRLELREPAVPGDAAGDPAREGSVTSVAKDPEDDSYLALAVVHRRDAAAETLEVRSSTGTQLARVQESPSLRSPRGDAS